MSSVSYIFLDDNYIDLLWFISIEWNLVGTWNLVAHPSTSTAQEPPTQLATEPAETVLMPAVGVPEALPEALEAEAIEAVQALEAVAEGGRNLGKRIWRNRWGMTKPVWSFEKARKSTGFNGSKMPRYAKCWGKHRLLEVQRGTLKLLYFQTSEIRWWILESGRATLWCLANNVYRCTWSTWRNWSAHEWSEWSTGKTSRGRARGKRRSFCEVCLFEVFLFGHVEVAKQYAMPLCLVMQTIASHVKPLQAMEADNEEGKQELDLPKFGTRVECPEQTQRSMLSKISKRFLTGNSRITPFILNFILHFHFWAATLWNPCDEAEPRGGLAVFNAPVKNFIVCFLNLWDSAINWSQVQEST